MSNEPISPAMPDASITPTSPTSPTSSPAVNGLTIDDIDVSESIVTVGVYDSLVEADLVRSELDSEGIESWVANATMTQTFIAMPETGLAVQVGARHAARAQQIADTIRNAPPVSDAEMEAAVAASEPEGD